MVDNKLCEDDQKLIFGVPVSVFIIGLVTFFTIISTEMILNILPLFTTSIGGTPLILGLIAGTSVFALYILYTLWYWMEDKFTKKKVIAVSGCLISNIAKPFIGFSPSWVYVLGLKTIECSGNCIRSTSSKEYCSRRAVDEEKALQATKVFESLGLILGSFFAFYLLFISMSYSQIIFLSIIPGSIAILLMLLLKSDANQEKNGNNVIQETQQKLEKTDNNFSRSIIIIGCLEIAGLGALFLIIRAVDYISINLIFLIPLFFLISNVIFLIFSYITLKVSKKRSQKLHVIMGLFILLISCILLAIPIGISLYSLIIIILLFTFYGFYKALVTPIIRKYISDLVAENTPRKSDKYYFLLIGFIALIKCIFIGFVYFVFSFTIAFIMVSIMIFFSIRIDRIENH